MKYRNLNAEMARRAMTKQDLCNILNDKGIDISYQKLCRQLRGESEISFEQAGVMSQIFNKRIDYIFATKEEG